MDTLLRRLGVNTHLKYMGVKNISTSVITIQNGRFAEFSTKEMILKCATWWLTAPPKNR